MAGSINKVILIGNLGADPEIRALPSGQMVANLSVATSEVYNDREGKIPFFHNQVNDLIVEGQKRDAAGK